MQTTAIIRAWALVLLLTAATVGLALSPGKHLTQYTLDVWMEQLGPYQANVTAIARTPDGYLWIGTEYGLLRFNGMAFTLFDNRTVPELGANYVYTLAVSPDGTLWIGTYGDGIVQYRNGRFEAFPGNDRLSGPTILSLLCDPDGTVWAGTDEHGLNRITGNTVTIFTEAQGLTSNDNVHALYRDRKGRLWVGTQRGVCRMKDDRFVPDNRIPDRWNDHVFSITESEDDVLWIGTFGHGLLRIPPDGKAERFHARRGLPSNMIRIVHCDEWDSLWIGTNEDGLLVYRNGRFQRLTEHQGLSDSNIRTMFQDPDGNIWIGTRNGLNRLKDGPITTFTTDEGLPGNMIRCVIPDRDGGVWIGTNTGGMARLDPDRKFLRVFSISDGLPLNSVFALHQDPNGTVLVGTYGKGVAILTGNRIRTWNGNRLLPSLYVRAFLRDRQGRLWVGTRNGIAVFDRSDRIALLSTDTGLPHAYIRFIRQTADGAIWVGTYAGLVRYPSGDPDRPEPVTGLSSSQVSCLMEEKDGTIWIGTFRGGLNRLKGTHVSIINEQNGLLDNKIFSIQTDRDGRFYFTSSKGIFFVKRADLNRIADHPGERLRCYTFGRRDGLKTPVCSRGLQDVACKDNVGRIWAATVKGVSVLDPAILRLDTTPPRVVLEAFQVDDERIQPGHDGIIIPPDHRRFAFRFAAIEFNEPWLVRFQYRLLPYDHDWQNSGNLTTAAYTRLPAGEYRFQVRARRENRSDWSRPYELLRFSVKPRIYDTTWFLPLIGLGFLLILWVADRVRNTARARRERKLQRIVDEQTRRIREDKEKLETAYRQLARIKDQLSQANLELRASNDMKSEVLSITAHDLRSPLSAILGFANLLAQKTGEQGDPPPELDQIIAHARRMLHAITDILEKASNEKVQPNLHLETVDLAELMRQMEPAFRSRIVSKNQRLEMYIPDTCCPVKGDRIKLLEIIENLVGNAIKYTPAGGRIQVSLDPDPAGGLVRIHVRDEGPGFTETDRDRLFQRYVRLSARPTEGEPATGLGLYIVKQFVDLHEGSIHLNSEPGRGATFTVTLPLISDTTLHSNDRRPEEGEKETP